MFARAPLGLWRLLYRSLLVTAVAAAILVAGFGALHASRYRDVRVISSFDVALTASIGAKKIRGGWARRSRRAHRAHRGEAEVRQALGAAAAGRAGGAGRGKRQGRGLLSLGRLRGQGRSRSHPWSRASCAARWRRSTTPICRPSCRPRPAWSVRATPRSWTASGGRDGVSHAPKPAQKVTRAGSPREPKRTASWPQARPRAIASLCGMPSASTLNSAQAPSSPTPRP